MARYQNPDVPEAEGAEDARPPSIDVEDAPAEYRDDVSKNLISLNIGSRDAADVAIGRETGDGSIYQQKRLRCRGRRSRSRKK